MEDVEEKKPVVNENVEYVSEQLEGAALEAFSDVFARFQAHAESSVVRSLLNKMALDLKLHYRSRLLRSYLQRAS